MSTRSYENKLIGALIGLARATSGNEHLISDSSNQLVLDVLMGTLPTYPEHEELLVRIDTEKQNMVPMCYECAAPCGKNNQYDMSALENAPADVRSLKYLLLSGIRDLAFGVYQAAKLGRQDETIYLFLYKALQIIGIDEFGVDDLLPIITELGQINLKCRALLD